ncbi:hypothetical protein BJY01DRAFT_230352 [Aspergillus pseudoustus]|uniref:Uncharacterized protein n=1 Tax=Aspergillus pseudoustus TaxID=1810923 RepID=A0ABR4ID29_9EURO
MLRSEWSGNTGLIPSKGVNMLSNELLGADAAVAVGKLTRALPDGAPVKMPSSRSRVLSRVGMDLLSLILCLGRK